MALVYNETEVCPEVLRKTLEDFTACTYPLKTLKRRLDFLTPHEKKRVLSNWKKIFDSCEKIDEIISNRAVIKDDKWP